MRQVLTFQANASQVGGLSGAPLFPHSLKALKTLRHALPPSIPIIGCGGITNGAHALEMARAGASFVQLYTAFGYRGVGCAGVIKDEISSNLAGQTWKSQVGSEAGEWEDQLGKVGAEVKREAESLADVLKHLRESAKDKVDAGSSQLLFEGNKLIRAAEQALGLPETQWSAERTAPAAIEQPSATTAAPSDPAVPAPSVIAPAVEAPSAHPLSEQDPLVAPSPNATLADAMKPIVVPVSDPVTALNEAPQTSAWTTEVREGSRRLV